MRKNSPFRMWGSWVGVMVVIVCGLHFAITNDCNTGEMFNIGGRNCHGFGIVGIYETPYFDSCDNMVQPFADQCFASHPDGRIWYGGWGINVGILFTIIPLIIGFLVGWFVESLLRKWDVI